MTIDEQEIFDTNYNVNILNKKYPNINTQKLIFQNGLEEVLLREGELTGYKTKFHENLNPIICNNQFSIGNIDFLPYFSKPQKPNQIVCDATKFFCGGVHPTTLCSLTELSRNIEFLKSTTILQLQGLDFGSGGGIIALAMLLLGISHVNTLERLETLFGYVEQNMAFHNIDKNRYNELCYHTVKDRQKYNIVATNVPISQFIRPYDRRIRFYDVINSIKPGGLLIISGINGAFELEEYNEFIEGQKNLCLLSASKMDGWYAFTYHVLAEV